MTKRKLKAEDSDLEGTGAEHSEDTGVPQPGDELDNPTGESGTGEEPEPTRKNEVTDDGRGRRQGHARDSSTGRPTAKSNEKPASKQSSGAKVASRIITGAKEVMRQEEKNRAEGVRDPLDTMHDSARLRTNKPDKNTAGYKTRTTRGPAADEKNENADSE
jgi:hypothetical protein